MNVSYAKYQDPPPTGNLGDDVQRFVSEVNRLDAGVRRLQAGELDDTLKGDIIQQLSSCTQLAKSIDASLKHMKEQRDVSKDVSYKRCLVAFRKSFATFQTLQQATTGIEQKQLQLARAESMRRSKRMSDPRENTKLLPHTIEQQAQTFADNELADLQSRERVVLQLEQDIRDMNTVFRDLATMVQDQGEIVNLIDTHVENAAIRVEEGRKELGRAVEYKNRNRKLKICIAVVVIVIILAVLIIILIVLGALGVFNK